MGSPNKPRAAATRTYRLSVDAQTCDGCGICVFYCKPKVFELSLEISARGVYPALVLRADACNGCRLCELGCPQLAIAITIVVVGDEEGKAGR